MHICVDTSAHIFKILLQATAISWPPIELMGLHTGDVVCLWQVEFAKGALTELLSRYRPFGQEILRVPGT